MSEKSRYHISEHDRRALLEPIRAELETLEARARHYQEHVPLRSREVEAALATAREALAAAREAIASVQEAVDDTDGEKPSERKRVLITGASGRIGSDLTWRLHERYALRLMVNRKMPKEAPVDDVVVANAARFDEVAAAVDGMDAVVHLAADPHTRAPWESVLENNIIGTYNVYEAARRAGVHHVVFASSNHAIGIYELQAAPELYDLDDDRVYDHTAEIRPDSLYGVS